MKKYEEFKNFYDRIPHTTNIRWYIERGFGDFEHNFYKYPEYYKEEFPYLADILINHKIDDIKSYDDFYN